MIDKERLAMYGKKKEKLYVYDLVENPAITYPMYYSVSGALCENDMFHDALIALHMVDFQNFLVPSQGAEIFATLRAGGFVIYKEQYVVGFFGGKLMYLESSGWKGLQATEDIFVMENWLV
ncbi:MAG TPA: hypothetical protein EYG95_06845 [Campylobacterales bacterium]|nr:hypothetical protein [Campylobacterales bacterium]